MKDYKANMIVQIHQQRKEKNEWYWRIYLKLWRYFNEYIETIQKKKNTKISVSWSNDCLMLARRSF